MCGKLLTILFLKKENISIYTIQVYRSKHNASYFVCKDIDICLQHLKDNEKLAVATSREHALNSPLISKQKIFCFRRSQSIYNYPVVIQMRKNFPFAIELNEFIKRAVEGGLIIKWRWDSQTTYKYEPDKVPLKHLTVEHMAGAFTAFFILGLCSIGACIAEQIVHRRARMRNAIRFWKIVDMLIDPERHFLLNPNSK